MHQGRNRLLQEPVRPLQAPVVAAVAGPTSIRAVASDLASIAAVAATFAIAQPAAAVQSTAAQPASAAQPTAAQPAAAIAAAALASNYSNRQRY